MKRSYLEMNSAMDAQFGLHKLRIHGGGSCRSQSLPVPKTPYKSKRRRTSVRPATVIEFKNASEFQIDGIISDGIYNVIYKIHKTSTAKCYVLKAGKRNLCMKGRDLSEVSICQKLQHHANICKFRMFYVYQGILHQIYEYYPLGTLKTLIQTQTNKLNTLQIIAILAQLANGLEYIHSKNIIHLDIKPENILFEKSKQNFYLLKIADFGISVDIDHCKTNKLPLRLPSGDPIYISPEILYQTLNASFDVNRAECLKNTDVFSLGILITELIQDVKLPSRGPIFEYLRNIRRDKKETINWDYIDLNVTKGAFIEAKQDVELNLLKNVVNHMLYQNPEHRISSTQLNIEIYKTLGAQKENSWKAFMELQIPNQIRTTRNNALSPTITYDADKINKIPIVKKPAFGGKLDDMTRSQTGRLTFCG
eukprot:131169_1